MRFLTSSIMLAGFGAFVVAACSGESLEAPRRVASSGGSAGTAGSGRAGSSGSQNAGVGGNSSVGGSSSDGGAAITRGGTGGRSGGGGQSTAGTGGVPRGEPCDNPGDRRVEEDCCFGDCFPAMTCDCTAERYWSCSHEHPCWGGQGPGGHGGLGGEGGNP